MDVYLRKIAAVKNIFFLSRVYCIIGHFLFLQIISRYSCNVFWIVKYRSLVRFILKALNLITRITVSFYFIRIYFTQFLKTITVQCQAALTSHMLLHYRVFHDWFMTVSFCFFIFLVCKTVSHYSKIFSCLKKVHVDNLFNMDVLMSNKQKEW